MLSLQRQRGVSLIEGLVALVIGGILLAMALPSFSAWITGTRIRATAEGLLSGLQLAKSEATTRNTQVRFQLTTSLDANCRRTTTSANWVVDVVDANAAADSVEGQCNAAPSDTVAPSILQLRAATETGSGALVNAGADQIIFNGLGRQAPVVVGGATNAVTVDITPISANGRCLSDGGKITCLRIVISPAGQVRMCNPSAASADPQSC
ncbi:pilus assembly FimT family protein [Roseateles sp. P5_E7]